MQSIISFVLTCYCLPFFVTALAFTWDYERTSALAIGTCAQALGGVILFAVVKQREWRWRALLKQEKEQAKRALSDADNQERQLLETVQNELQALQVRHAEESERFSRKLEEAEEEAGARAREVQQLTQYLEGERRAAREHEGELEQLRKHCLDGEEERSRLMTTIATLEARIEAHAVSSRMRDLPAERLVSSAERAFESCRSELSEMARAGPIDSAALALHLFERLGSDFSYPIFLYETKTERVFFSEASCKQLGWRREVLEAEFFSFLINSQKVRKALLMSGFQPQKEAIRYGTKWGTTQEGMLLHAVSLVSDSHVVLGLIDWQGAHATAHGKNDRAEPPSGAGAEAVLEHAAGRG